MISLQRVRLSFWPGIWKFPIEKDYQKKGNILEINCSTSFYSKFSWKLTSHMKQKVDQFNSVVFEVFLQHWFSQLFYHSLLNALWYCHRFFEVWSKTGIWIDFSVFRMTTMKTNFSFWTNFAKRMYSKNRFNNAESVSCLKSLIRARLVNILQPNSGKAAVR